MGASFRPSDDENGDDGVVAEINITPLTDVFLVLLIIFMVTTSVIQNQGKNIDLPGAEVSDATPQGVTVTVSPDGGILVNDEPDPGERSLQGALGEAQGHAREDRDPARRQEGAARSGREHPRPRAAGRRHRHRARHQTSAQRRLSPRAQRAQAAELTGLLTLRVGAARPGRRASSSSSGTSSPTPWNVRSVFWIGSGNCFGVRSFGRSVISDSRSTAQCTAFSTRSRL